MALADQDPDFGMLDAGDDSANVSEKYIPPRSAAFRTSMFPGWWSVGSNRVTNPNPLAGDAPEAQLSGGETGVPITPAAGIPQQESTFRIMQPSLGGQNDGGTSADERAANREQEVKSAGVVTNPADFARAINLGLSLTSPTGIAGLAATTAANLLGAPDEVTDPAGALLGDANGGPFDIKSNLNRRPGYSAAYDEGLRLAHLQGVTGSQAAQRALNHAQETLTGGSAAWGRPGATQPRDPSGAKPAAPAVDVTAANAQTGFQRPTPAGVPNAGGVGSSNQVAPNQQTLGFTATTGVPSQAPAAPAAPAKTGGNSPGAGGSNSNAGRGAGNYGRDGNGHSTSDGARGFESGGVVTEWDNPDLSPAELQRARERASAAQADDSFADAFAQYGKSMRDEMANPDRREFAVEAILNAHTPKKTASGYATGGDVVNPEQRRPVSQIQHFDVGDEQQDEPPIDRGYAMAPHPEEDPRYNPPPAATDPRGIVDGVQIAATPGELVVQRPAATAYSPSVKALINDPSKAPDVAELLEAYARASGYGSASEVDDESVLEAMIEAVSGADNGAEPYRAEHDDDYYEAAAVDDGVSDDNSGYGASMPRRHMPVPPGDPRNQLVAGAGRNAQFGG